MERFEIVDLTDDARFRLIPPCADPAFDHRTCDYWEDPDRGSKASRSAWLHPAATDQVDRGQAASSDGANPFAPAGRRDDNPFAPPPRPRANPFAPSPERPVRNPLLDGLDEPRPENPFAPRPVSRPAVPTDAPRKLQLLGRGLAVFGSYAKVLLMDGEPAAYCQFGPLSAYPRALRLRELYPQLPDAPLPAVITCIATSAAGRGHGHARALVAEVCRDLAGRGFAAVEAYPETGARPEATSVATPGFWLSAGFALAVHDERYPVMRREL